MASQDSRGERWHRGWDRQARTYDRQMRWMDRVFLRGSRPWACSRATGDVLEVAVGTGLNLAEYPEHVRLTGIDLSEAMLEIARGRATELGREVSLLQGNAHELPFAEATFDTVVCTLGLCTIPDPDRAVGEMRRVLRPGGRLILVDHIASSVWALRVVQRLMELVTVPLVGEHFLRRPLHQVHATGLAVEHSQRFTLGIVERVVARKPAGNSSR
ncbi:ubiquinone/menaquinone biosynthesis methyltransferase [Longimycelium tulufanense]|uniref:Ubiquinone/menaquinone biosynthesis methyltransferase n=1 Tax=Longimycelium tulufanense TaxID=907463 RepID=A0A8J3FU13_9PSEU|nr:class I SAM-dependent methyltransferase [Longimycelium tulufanense]GGM51273.1 ubiquinone/menaquinone biosynthesis methyltransferase [Longimycelium tulufanense]